MSCQSVHGWKALVAAACLAGLFPGCHVPPVPSHATPQSSTNADQDEGWLFKKLTGQKAAGSQASTKPGAQSLASSPYGVQQASGIEPASDADALRNRGTVLPPAGVADPKPKTDDDEGGFDWSDLYPSTIYKKAQAAMGMGPDERIARAAYQEGETLYRQRKFAEAEKHFKTAADRWPDTPLEEDALFYLAECQFFTDQYSKALDTYGTLLKKHENSRYLDKAVAREFAIGRYWEQYDKYDPHWVLTPNFTDKGRPFFDTWGYAIKAYENVRLSDPTGPMADHALMASADAHFVRGHYEDAAHDYDLVRTEYSNRSHVIQASVLGMKSKLMMYHGPMYDGRPLLEADEIAKKTLENFPDRLGAEREHLIQARNQMVEQMAEREWSMGQYYERRRYYGAARIHYQTLIKSHPQTHFAQMAKTRLDEIKDRPARPPDYFKWLDDVLPSKHNKVISQSPR